MKRFLPFLALGLLLTGCSTLPAPQGTYKGSIVSGTPTTVYTTFYDQNLTQKEKINGVFMYKEANIWVTGSIRNCQFTPDKKATCHWQDKYGVGVMTLQFNEQYDSFSGHWGTYCGPRSDQTWNGIHTQETLNTP